MSTGRVKHVVPTGEVAHLWAHKVQANARNSQGNVYFEGDTIYSYGSHFPIARHVTNKKGEAAVLLTTDRYSVTTSGHISMVRSAVSHLTVFHVPDIDPMYSEVHRNNLEDYAKRINTSLLKSAKAVKSDNKSWHHNQASELREEAIKYATFFHVAYKRILPEVPTLGSAELAAIKTREKERLAKLKAKTLKDNAEAIAKWRAGEHVSLPYGLPDMLRIVTRLGSSQSELYVLQTSRDAEVPIHHAKRALALVRAVRARGEDWKANGHTCKVGYYEIETISASGDIKARCHFIRWAEIDRIAPELDAIPTDTAIENAIKEQEIANENQHRL